MALDKTEAKELLPVIQAFSEGRIIQFRSNPTNKWADMKPDGTMSFNYGPECYRIKPAVTQTYHLLFQDGSMSAGKTLPSELHRLYGNRVPFSAHKVLLTREGGKPIRMEVIE